MESERTGTYRVLGVVDPVQFCANVDSGVLEGRDRIQVVVFEGVEVKDARDDREDVLAQCVVEGERLEARERVFRRDELLPRNRRAGIYRRIRSRRTEGRSRDSEECREGCQEMRRHGELRRTRRRQGDLTAVDVGLKVNSSE